MKNSPSFLAGGPVQLAYHVDDPAAAATQAAERFGWGPFFVLQHVPLEWSRYRGRPMPFDHTSAYGQAGELMVEFITQHDDAPSALRDMYARGRRGLHHVAYFVPDLARAVEEAAAAGYAAALEARTTTGVEFVMLDATVDLAHMIELYEPAKPLLDFYGYVKHKSLGWDGSRPVRPLG